MWLQIFPDALRACGVNFFHRYTHIDVFGMGGTSGRTPANAGFRPLNLEDLLEEGMATYSSILLRINGQRSLLSHSPLNTKVTIILITRHLAFPAIKVERA